MGSGSWVDGPTYPFIVNGVSVVSVIVFINGVAPQGCKSTRIIMVDFWLFMSITIGKEGNIFIITIFVTGDITVHCG